MPNAQKITNVYRSAYLQNRLSLSSAHFFDKYDVVPETMTENSRDLKNQKYFKTVLKEVTAKRHKV